MAIRSSTGYDGANGGATTLNDLTDVSTTGVSSGQALVFDGIDWEPAQVAPVGISATPIPFTGDGAATSFDATHNFDTRSVEWYFEDSGNSPVTGISWVPTVGDEANSSTVTIPGPLGNGVTVNGYARPASNSGAVRLQVYAIDGHTTGIAADSSYANIAAFEAAIVPSSPAEACELLGWPTAAATTLLEARRSGAAVEWQVI